MAALTVNNIVDAGTAAAFTTPTASDTVSIGNGHNTFVQYKNASGSPVTVTVVSHFLLDNGDTAANHVLTLPATTGELLIPIRKSYDDGTGNATITTSAQASVTVRAMLMS